MFLIELLCNVLEMKCPRILISLFFLVTIIHAGRFGCPPRTQIKSCLCAEKNKGLDVSCENSKPDQLQWALQSIAMTRQSIWYLKLRDNKLVNLPKTLLDGLDVRHLIILRSNISSVDAYAFATLLKLESLDLAQNDLEKVPSQALSNLGTLLSLNLNNNKLEILHAEAFKGLHSLLRLSLYGNRIKFIDNLAFIGIGPNLTRINIGGNLLTAVPSRSLKSLLQLQRLQLQDNFIEALLPAEFAIMGGESLDVLDLSNNRVKVLPSRAFMSLHALNSLDLEQNRIYDINIHAFEGIEDSLEWLKLGVNRLDQVPAESLRNLSRLRQLDLRGNNISKVKEDDFMPYGKNLKFVYLQNNWLTSVDAISLVNLDSLEWLDLQSNQLNTFPYETYTPVMNTLTVFDIHDNPIHCDCTIAWLRDWLQNKGSSVAKLPQETKCDTPDDYQGMPLTEIPDDRLVCNSSPRTTYHNFHIVCLQLFFLAFGIFLC